MSQQDTGTHNPAATYDYWPPSAVGHNTRHVLAKPKVRRHPQHYHNQDHHLEGRGHHQHQPARGGGGDGGGRRTQRGSNKNEASATAKAAAAAVAAEVGCKKKIPAGLSPQFSALTPEKSRTYSSRNPMVSASQNTTATKSQNRSDRLYHPSAAAVEERVQSSGKAVRGSAQPRAAEEVPATCPNSGFGSSSSLGSMMGEEINAAGASAWKVCVCVCVENLFVGSPPHFVMTKYF